MVKISSIFALGVAITVMQFLGFSSAVKNYFYFLAGLAIVVLSILIRGELHEVLRHLHGVEIKTDTFSQSAPQQKEEDK
ncbi:MAG: hypothetical protein WC827_02255 [Candidatus Paceibacterota bacterium]|jgi:hypothetical protein